MTKPDNLRPPKAGETDHEFYLRALEGEEDAEHGLAPNLKRPKAKPPRPSRRER